MAEEKGLMSRQFTLKSMWDRLTRSAAVAVGFVTALGRVPESTMEWVGVAGAILGASYTGK